MRARARALLLVAALAPASCRSCTPAAEPEVTVLPDPAPGPSPGPAPYPLGEVCDASKRPPRASSPDAGAPELLTEGCGRDGRVALVRFMSARFPPIPATVTRDTLLGGTVRVSFEGSRITVDTNCPYCRSQHEERWIGDLARMTDEQRVSLQQASVLPAAPLLADAAAWRRALAAR